VVVGRRSGQLPVEVVGYAVLECGGGVVRFWVDVVGLKVGASWSRSDVGPSEQRQHHKPPESTHGARPKHHRMSETGRGRVRVGSCQTSPRDDFSFSIPHFVHKNNSSTRLIRSRPTKEFVATTQPLTRPAEILVDHIRCFVDASSN
jgi:hypothetical protein